MTKLIDVRVQPRVRDNDYGVLSPPPLGAWDPHLPVSVVIPAYGGQEKLDLTLAALAAQTYPAQTRAYARAHRVRAVGEDVDGVVHEMFGVHTVDGVAAGIVRADPDQSTGAAPKPPVDWPAEARSGRPRRRNGAPRLEICAATCARSGPGTTGPCTAGSAAPSPAGCGARVERTVKTYDE